MKTTIQLKHRSAWFLALLTVCTMAVSCSKNDEKPETEPEIPAPTTPTVPYYKVQRVENFAVETDDANPTERKTSAIFSLRYKKEQPLSYSKTSYWDISVSGLYNSFLGGNNGENLNNRGYRGPGKGGITIVEKAFDQVTDIPASTQFLTGDGIVGTDNNGDFGSGLGWYIYDFGGTIMSDGSANKKHVAYALGSPLTTVQGKTISARTIIVKLANGDFAKIKMISCYKDALTPDKWFLNTPHMFYTFEYLIVPAGSTKFEIR